MPDPHFKDLILPANSQLPLNELLTSLKRDNLSIRNRLRSIAQDAAFVDRVGEAFGRPLVANERCGSWYVRPESKKGSAYFKSTDGHERAWKFSTRRLNLQVVGLVEENDGVIIVDSTRRGKRMPDALSTTIPIWCTVINQLLLPSNHLSQILHLPPSHSPSTHAQISALIPEFLASLKSLHLSSLPALTKPLRPFWVTQDSALLEPDGDAAAIFEDYRPVICCTASRRITAATEVDENGYIQGAGDDTENWAHGLTPDVFWNNYQDLMLRPEEEQPELISRLMQEQKAKLSQLQNDRSTRLTPHILVCPLPLNNEGACQIVLSSEAATPQDQWVKSARRMEVGLGKNKNASKNLRLALPKVCNFVSAFLKEGEGTGDVVVACESGKDLSVGTALALSCYLFDDDNTFRVPDGTVSFTKTFVKIRLGHIMTQYPEGNPSRNTLQSVNSFLMDWRN